MENVASDLAKTYLEKLIDGAISESRYLFCMPRIEKEYEKERDRLEAERTTIRERANVATRRGDEIQANVRHWEEEVDGVMGEDENAAQTKQKCFCGICPNCVWRYKRGKELANKTEQIKLLIEKGEKLENVGVPSQLPGVERYSSQYYIPFESRESTYKELLNALKDDSNYIVGLQGMGGTGKTTLAKEVGKKLKQSEGFSKVIVTVVSCTPDIKKIQDDIAGQLGLEWGENCNQSDRPGKLWKRLTDGEKILVILDDVWDQDPLDFEAIGIPEQDKHGGCKLLVTTRTKQILINVDCNKIIEVEQISEDEAWIMFKRYAGINNNDMSESLVEMGRKIAEECKRLPVAISVIASSLKGKHDRPHVWNTTLNSLKNHVSMQGVDEERVGIYKYLKPSYDNMRHEKAKGLFLLCSLFPEDEEISIETITRLSIGAGLFGEDYGRYDDARNQVVVAKDKLLDSCLLLQAGEGCVKMHDLVRDGAQWIKKEEIRAVDLSHGDPNLLVENENSTTKYMFCKGKAMDVLSSRFGGSNLEILIAFFDMDVDYDDVQVEVPNSMFENIARLRVMHLKGELNYGHILAPSLPKSIQSLKNIRSLLVESVDLEDISVLGNLQSLETLDLVKCAINELPREIKRLKKFKLLKLEQCEIRQNNPFQVIGGCSSLKELYFIDSFNSFCQEIKFLELQRYHIYRRKWDLRNESRSKCVVFRANSDVGFFSEATLKYCMKTAEILCLEEIKRVWRNLIPEIVPIDQGMNDLVHLHLQRISQLQCLIDANDSNVPNVMSKLVVLELIEVQNLKELFSGPISFDSLKSLEKLKIKDCNYLQSLFKYKQNLCNLKIVKLVECSKLVSLFQLSTSRSLVMLEELSIIDCEQLESIIIIDDESREGELKEAVVDGDNDNKSHGSMFQKLTLLSIEGCPVLECIFPFLPAPDLSVLETIDIRKCDGLKYIFGQDVELGSLKEIFLEELTNFIDIFPKSYLPMSSSMKGLSSTSKYCSKASTQSDPTKCNSFSGAHICCYGDKNKHKLRTNTSAKLSFVSQDLLRDYSIASAPNSYHLPIQPHILCNIKVILLSHFSKIKSVFSLALAQRMLLESLIVMNCDELKNIIVDTKEDNGQKNWGNVFPKLKELYVENCVQLEYIFGHHTLDHQNNNEIGEDNSGNNWANVFPKLKELHVENCEQLKDSQIQIHLPVLKDLKLCKLPSLVAVCPKNYLTTFPSLAEVALSECSQFAIDTDFVSHSIPDAIDNTTIKESNSYLLHSWERAQCLLIQPHIMCNITMIELSHLSKIKSVFILFVASRILKMLESLIIEECDELKHVILDTGEDNSGNNWANVFPKLEELRVENCEKLEYIFGHYAVDYQNDSQIQLHLPVLKDLKLRKLPSLVAVCPKTYITTFPSLTKLVLSHCSQVPINSIGDLVGHSIPESIDNTTIKEWSGDVDYFCALERLSICDIQVENFFCLNEKCEEKVNLGPINSATLQNLRKIDIERCDKLDIIFTTCVIRCLPQLYSLSIEECKELKHIIEEDAVEGQKIPTSHSLKTCFPKLTLLRIVKCNKLKYVFPVSICKRLPELQTLIIREAHELEEIFTSTEGDYKIEIPNLKLVAFEDLPSIWQGQGIQFQAVENRLFRNCPKLSQTSASTPTLYRHFRIIMVLSELIGLLERIREDSEKQDTCGENPSIGSNIATIEEEDDKLVSSPASENEQSMDKQCPLGETDTTVIASQRNYNNGLKEIDDKSIQEDAASEKTTISKQKDDGNGQKAMPSFSAKEDINIRGTEKSIKTHNQEPKPFVSIPSAHASESPSIPSKDTIVAAEDEEVSENKLISSPIQIVEAGHELVAGLEIPSMANLPTTSKASLNERSMDEQCPPGEIDTTVTSSQGVHNIVLKEIEDQSIQEDAASEQIITSKQKDDGNGQKAMPSFSSAKEDVDVRGTQKSIDTSDQVSFNDRVAVKMSSVIEDQLSISKDYGKGVLESKPSLTIPSVFSSQSPSIPSEGHSSQIVEDLSSSLIIRELEQLYFNKQLAAENISLLTDFLVKHPSVRLTNDSLTNRRKGYAYNCLAELLKFLQTHSVLDALGSNHSEFVELLQDMHSFAFDKQWLDGVERRVFSHVSQVSQDRDALQKLLHSKQEVTKKVEMLHLKIDFFTQQLEDHKHQLESSEATLKSINKQEKQVLEAKAALSTPIGY